MLRELGFLEIPIKTITYIASWKSGYAYDNDGNQIIIDGKGVFNPTFMDKMSEEELNETIQSLGPMAGIKITKGVTSLLTRTQSTTLVKLENIITNNLKEGDFSGTLRDLQGNPVVIGGKIFDHLTEMKQSYVALQKIKESLQGSLQNPNLGSEVRQVISDSLNKANSYINKIEELFAPYGGIRL